jgi:hypothetical protein
MGLSNGLPNLVVVGVGHSGTTIVTQMLGKLGWNMPSADARYAEHTGVREANGAALSHDILPAKATSVVRALVNHKPWVIKDPRFTVTLHLWDHLFAKCELSPPTLVWVQKDLKAVKRSYIKRKEVLGRGQPGNKWAGATRGITVDEQWRAIEDQVKTWSGPVFELKYEQLTALSAMFTPR